MYKFGIVGGGIISRSHVYAINHHDDCELVAICDIDIEKAKKIAEDTGAHPYTDYKEMQEKEALDAVILNLPHFLHKEASIYFLDHKVSVLVEKPMANTVAECDAMIEAAKRNHTALAIGHVQRYTKKCQTMKELVENKALGELCMVTESRYNYYFNEDRPRWFLKKEQAGGGITMNYGAHSLDFLFYATGLEADTVTGIGSNLLTDDTIESEGQILMRLSNGACVNLSYCGCPTQGETWEFTYHFTNGRVINRNGKIFVAVGMEAPQEVDTTQTENIFCMQLDEFVKLLQGEESNMATPEHGRKVIAVLEKAISEF